MRCITAILIGAIALAMGTPAQAGQGADLADVSIGDGGVTWQPRAACPGLSLSVSMPDGQILERAFPEGVAPRLATSGVSLPDGQYMWELRTAVGESGVRGEDDPASEPQAPPARVQSGSFAVSQGAIVDPAASESTATKDVLHYDDVIITGSLGVGWDCANGESFGYDTVKLKENNLRLFFEDTSIGSFPSGDWRIRINDTTSGGASYFAIEDGTNGRTPFRIETGAPTHSLYVEDYGRVGLGTSIPYVELHIVDGDSPTIRLDQDGSSGWAAQRWDLCGNETNFFIRDVTNGSKLCFRIQPNTPSNTLCMRSTGYVGIGTWSPGYPLEVETTGEPAQLVLDRTDGALAYVGAGHTYVNMGSGSAHPLRLMVEGASKMSIGTDGYVGIGTDTPGWPFELETTGETAQLVLDRTDGALAYMGAGHTFVNMGSGSWNHLRLMVNGDWKAQINTDGALHMASGASCTTGGVWTNSSSRDLKDNIESLTADEAMETLAGLDPVKYNYKADKSEAHVGFIAEDVPGLVATKDRKGMSPMDVAAVLTKVVQEQEERLRQQQLTISEQQRMMAELRSRLEAVEQQVKR